MVTGSGSRINGAPTQAAIAMVIAPASNGRAAVRRRLVQQAADFAVRVAGVNLRHRSSLCSGRGIIATPPESDQRLSAWVVERCA